MDDLVNETAGTVEKVVEPGAATATVEKIADKIEDAAELASEASQDAASHTEHEVLSGVAAALKMLEAELKRANDLREFETKQATEAVAAASETATAPIAEVVDTPATTKKVRRGARKIKR